MNSRLFPAFLVAACLTLLFLTAAHAEPQSTSVKFSDPAKPGVLKIRLGQGDLRLSGVTSDTGECTVRTDAAPAKPAKRKDGLRVITDASSYALSEDANVITLDATQNWGNRGGSDFAISVPRNTAVIVSSAWGGDITCSDLAGDLEIKGVNGEVKLINHAGGAVVESMNGEITARILELNEGKPLSFTSMNGEVALHLPAAAKANIRLRTQNGSILTDFDETALVTKTENAPRTTGRTKRTTNPSRRTDGTAPTAAQTHDEIHTAVREAVQAGAEAAREAAIAVREAMQAARDGVQAARDAADAAGTPMPPLAPTPPLPPMTGGKIVSGTLNGGGPEIRVTTMNGDVTLRKVTAEK
jgi:hypothetical protein